MSSRTGKGALQELWTCPRCGVKLLTRNLSHSCGRATLAEWESRMGPRAQALYRRFRAMLDACGVYHVAPAKTRISFLALVRFANITRLTESHMDCNFALPAPVRSARIARRVEIVPGWWVHHLRVESVDELGDEVQAWLRDSYRFMGMRERLTGRKADHARQITTRSRPVSVRGPASARGRRPR